MRHLLLVCALLTCSFAVSAAKGPGAVRKQVESSLLVTGSIDVDASGKVVGYALDEPQALPEGIVAMAAAQVPLWAFEPMVLPADQTRTHSQMSLRFIAKKSEGQQSVVSLQGAQFFNQRNAVGFPIDREHSAPILYPLAMRRLYVTGTVYMAVRVDRDGKVLDSAVEQINLTVVGSESETERWRQVLGRHWQQGVKGLRFDIPDSAFAENNSTLSGRIGFYYKNANSPSWKYGDWEPHVPGPHTRIDWLPDPDARPDTFRPGTLHTAGSDRRLLTPLTGH
jgi:hypothetical protein